MHDVVIETSGLTRVFGNVNAVAGLDLRVEAGKFYGFLGPNGAGKSTTIKMLTGLLAPSSGHIRILGENLSDENRAREPDDHEPHQQMQIVRKILNHF